MPQVKLEPLGIYVNVSSQEMLLPALQRAKVELAAVCGGEGTCGTCALQVFAGSNLLSPMQPLEQSTLYNINKDPKYYRLTCQTRIYGEGISLYLDNRAARKLNEIFDRLKNRLAPRNIYHPLTGELIVAQGETITQAILEQLFSTS